MKPFQETIKIIVKQYLNKVKSASVRDVFRNTPVSQDTARKYLDQLVADGYLTVSVAARQKRIYQLKEL